jgi:hypothetical protein
MIHFTLSSFPNEWYSEGLLTLDVNRDEGDSEKLVLLPWKHISRLHLLVRSTNKWKQVDIHSLHEALISKGFANGRLNIEDIIDLTICSVPELRDYYILDRIIGVS